MKISFLRCICCFEDGRCINVFGKLWVESAGRRWLNVKVLVHDLLLSPHKGRTACEQFIGKDGKCILVGSIYWLTAPLLRCHISWRTANGMAHIRCDAAKSGNAEVRQQ